MRKKHLLACLLLACFVMVLAAPSNAAISLSFSLTAPNVDPGDALMVAAAGLFFGLDTELAVSYRSDIGSPTATVSLFYLAAESGTAPDVYVAEKKKGRGWGAIAQGKMPPGLVGKWKGGDPFLQGDIDFETGLSINFLSSYYTVSQDDIIIWVKQGMSVTDVALCLNLASRMQVKPSVVVDARAKGESWVKLTGRYKVSIELLKQPVAPKAKHTKKVIPPGLAKKGNK